MLCFGIDRQEITRVHAMSYTWLITRLDPIKYIFEKPSLSRRIAKWQVLLSEYDIRYVYKKAIKRSPVAEFLAKKA